MAYINKKGYQLVGNVLIDSVTGQETDKNNPNAIYAFVDDYSGELYPRPGTNAALEFYDNSGGYEVLVCKHRDRYTRSGQATSIMNYDFIDVRGISIEFVDGFKNEDTPEGNLTAGFIDLMSEYENIRRAKRSKDGKLHYAKELNKIRCGGRSPFGYTYVKDSLGGLKIQEEEAETVKLIYKLYTVDSLSIRGITDYLNENNIDASLGSHWGKSSVFKILSNETYSGTTYYNRRRRIKNRMTNKIYIKDRDKEEWAEFPCPAIVDRKTWKLAQSKLEHNKISVRQQSKRFYMMSGMVFCKNCNHPYAAQTMLPNGNKRLVETQSYRHRTKEGHCMNHQISATVIENLVWEEIQNFLMNPETLRTGYESALAKEKEKHARSFFLLEQTNKKMENCEKRKQNLLRLRTDPLLGDLISNDDFLKQWKEVEQEEKDNRAIIADLKEELSSIPTRLEFETLEKFAHEVQVKMNDAKWKPTPRNKRRIFELLHIKVHVLKNSLGISKNDIQITGWFNEGLLSKTCSHTEQKTFFFYLPLTQFV